MKIPEPLQQVGRIYVLSGGRRLSYFAGCDYFRLASHPKVIQAAHDGISRYGLNVAASRMTTGNHPLYGKLESAIAGFFDVESATLSSNGYSPNLMVAQALKGSFSHALVDERAHGCLVDAATLLDCPVIRFKHRDAADLQKQLERLGAIKPLLLTDGMFSHDGSLAPLSDYLKVLPKSGQLLVDDAHAAGVLGDNGRGSPEFHGISRRRIIQTITLSKAFGVYGGAVLSDDKALRKAILERSRVFSGNTPLPLPLANAALQSVALLQKNHGLRTSLRQNIATIRSGLGLPINNPGDLQNPIIALMPNGRKMATVLNAALLKAGIHSPHIIYPGGPKDGYFRFAISSEHGKTQLNALVNSLKVVMK